MEHVTIYHEPGRFAGWPANYGIWSWGDEIVSGFFLGTMKPNEQFHARDRSQPFVAMQVHSRDGGQSWEVYDIPITEPKNRRISADEHMTPDLWVANTLHEEDILKPPPGNINFTHPDFALLCARTHLRQGSRSWFYVSTDRCAHWEGPYRLPMFGQSGMAARTDYIVDGPQSCTLFLTAAKPNGDEGRVLCARTTDGGKTFQFVGWVMPEPAGYAIMSASVRLPSGRLLCSARYSDPRVEGVRRRCWIDLTLHACPRHWQRWQSANADPVARRTACDDLRLSRCAVRDARPIKFRWWRNVVGGASAAFRRGQPRHRLSAHDSAGRREVGHSLLLELHGGRRTHPRSYNLAAIVLSV
jgi:hypothetical protein